MLCEVSTCYIRLPSVKELAVYLLITNPGRPSNGGPVETESEAG